VSAGPRWSQVSAQGQRVRGAVVLVSSWLIISSWGGTGNVTHYAESAGQFVVAAGLVAVGVAPVAQFVAQFVALGAAAVLVGAPGEGVVEGLAQQCRLWIHRWQVVSEQDGHGLLEPTD
jgi:hypothetical protein